MDKCYCYIDILNLKPKNHCFQKTILSDRDGSYGSVCFSKVFWYNRRNIFLNNIGWNFIVVIFIKKGVLSVEN